MNTNQYHSQTRLPSLKPCGPEHCGVLCPRSLPSWANRPAIVDPTRLVKTSEHVLQHVAENHGKSWKIMEKSWKNHGKSWKKHGKSWKIIVSWDDFSIPNMMGKYGKVNPNSHGSSHHQSAGEDLLLGIAVIKFPGAAVMFGETM